MNIVDSSAKAYRGFFRAWSRLVTYRLHSGEEKQIMVYIRGLKEDDVFAGAMQQDQLGEIDAAEFVAAFPSRFQPQRFDRVITIANNQSYAVEAFRGAPNDGVPIFFKLQLRGGQQ